MTHFTFLEFDQSLISFSFYTFLDYEVAKNIVLVINALICLSYPVNFAIYCGMSRWCNMKIDMVGKSDIISWGWSSSLPSSSLRTFATSSLGLGGFPN